ncbi:MAG: class I SAM-dependent methyltransferase [Thaumarchaeota archaeon]|nr:class I SAM-dependent methyltransferase [Nitrososphaerota archaeon]
MPKEKTSILFWGYNENAITLIKRMLMNGTAEKICGIIDSNKELQGCKIENFIVMNPKSINELQFDTLVIVSDNDKEEILKIFSTIDNRKPKIIMAGIGHLDFKDHLYHDTLSSSVTSPRAFGYKNMLIHLYQSLDYIAKNGLKGDIAEFGVYKGGTTVFLARIVEKLGIKAKIFAFDTFQGFPKRKSVFDMYDDPHDEFSDFDSVISYCEPFNIELVKGDISETYCRIEGIPLVLSFFDTDNYSPTRDALDMCYRQTVKGGIIAFDHYCCDERWLYTLGERIAASEFFRDKNVLNLYGTGVFLKI